MALTAFAGVVLVGTLQGIIIAIVVSLVAAGPPGGRSADVRARKQAPYQCVPTHTKNIPRMRFRGLLLLRFEGRVFFANAGHVAHKAKLLVDEAQPKIVVFNLSGVYDLEYTALKRMLTEAEKRQRQHGIRLWLVGMNPHVLEVIHRSHLSEVLGRDSLHFNLETAVGACMKLGVVVGETP